MNFTGHEVIQVKESDLTQPPFPAESDWPEFWVEGRKACKHMDQGFHPSSSFDNNMIPDELIRDWLKEGLAVEPEVIEGTKAKGKRYAQFNCKVMGLTTFGQPVWRSFSAKWIEISEDHGDADKDLIKKSYLVS